MKNIILIIVFIVAYTVTIVPQDDWSYLTPPVSPSARAGHGMASIGDDKVLMFGGSVDLDFTLSNETWIYDLSENTWTNMSPQGGVPTARVLHTMAFIGDDKVLLFGG